MAVQAVVTGSRALQATTAFGEDKIHPLGRIKASFAQFLRRKFLRAFAIFTDYTNQALSHDAVQSRDEIVRLDTHVDEAADNVGDVVGMDGSEHQVAGQGGLNGDLSGFLVADFARP